MTARTGDGNGKQGGISRFFPIVGWLPNYDRAWLKADLIAGLSVWALMVPTSMGYATISGVPVQYGLYAAALGLIAFALFTTSKQVTEGPSSSTAAVLGAAVLGVASAGSDEALAKIAKAGAEVGVDLHLARVKTQVMEVLEKDGVVDLIGGEYIHHSVPAAVLMHVRKHPEDAPDWDLSELGTLVASSDEQ